jgi:hypothetical protein
VAHPEGSRAVKVGVVLPGQPDHLGEWLADGAAFDAAGADALWLDPAPDAELDPLVLAAALAAVTFRALLVVTVPEPSPALARTIATIEGLSRGRLRTTAEISPERWVRVPFPDSRATWRAVRADAAQRGSSGLLIPADPRLLDLLRNPDDPDDRRDLQLAVG